MRIRNLGIVVVLLVVLSLVVFADSDHGNFSEAKEIIEQKIPYGQLTDDQFELLGDYFMELQTGENHAFMDRMMGGEGSEHLRQAHITMGKNFYNEYLETGTIEQRGMRGGMMGSGMMGSSFSYMMMPGAGHSFYGFGIFGLLLTVAFLGLVIWLIYLIYQKTKLSGKRKSALDLLKERYAKGEITKKEYETMREELRK